MDIEALRFPIGEYRSDKNPSDERLNEWINDIELFPERVSESTTNSTIESLNWKYRPKGWNVKQVIHHCADSHMNSLIRFKLSLTEDSPTIRPYYEDRWAELIDSKDDDVSDSLLLLNSLHRKWVKLLKTLDTNDLKKDFIHPEHGTKITLAENIGIYAWHCNHHLAHIKLGLESKGKYNEF